MNREDFLKALGLSNEEFQDLLHKFDAFFGSLNKSQQEVVRRSLPTVAEALEALRPNVTEDELGRFFGGDLQNQATSGYFWSGPHPNPPKPRS